MADIGNLPQPGQKPWDLRPAIVAVNSESSETKATITTGRLSPTGVSNSVSAGVSAATGVTVRAQNDQNEKRNIALRPFRLAVANIDNAPVPILSYSDSILEGYNLGAGGSWNKTDRPMDRLFAELSRLLPVTGAAGAGPYVPVRMASSLGPATGWPWTLSGSPALSLDSMGLGVRTNIVSGAQYVEYTDTNMDTFRVAYAKGPLAGSLRIKLDGTTVTTIAVNDVSRMTDGFFYDVAIPDALTHTIRIEAASGAVYVHGGMPFRGNKNKGWQIFEGGHSNAGTKLFTATSPNPVLTYIQDQVLAIQPKLVLLSFGANDYLHATQKITSAQFETNTRAIISAIRATSAVPPSIALCMEWEVESSTVTPLSPWSEFRNAWFNIAAGDSDIFVFDMAQRVRTAPPIDNARGILADKTHLSALGSKTLMPDLARTLVFSS